MADNVEDAYAKFVAQNRDFRKEFPVKEVQDTQDVSKLTGRSFLLLCVNMVNDPKFETGKVFTFQPTGKSDKFTDIRIKAQPTTEQPGNVWVEFYSSYDTIESKANDLHFAWTGLKTYFTTFLQNSISTIWVGRPPKSTQEAEKWRKWYYWEVSVLLVLEIARRCVQKPPNANDYDTLPIAASIVVGLNLLADGKIKIDDFFAVFYNKDAQSKTTKVKVEERKNAIKKLIEMRFGKDKVPDAAINKVKTEVEAWFLEKELSLDFENLKI